MTRRAIFLLSLFPVFSVACTAPTADEDTGSSDEDLAYDKTSPKWIYAGMLPSLDAPEITVSLASSTARVTGLLPDDFAGDLPFYAVETQDGARRRLTVVYPVATGAHTNGPGNYQDLRGVPYVVTNAHAEWGGFPYLEYNHPRGLALHGPITHQDHEWHLIRGPVSHGCNRMQGEHVVEVAQLIGIDMSRPHGVSDVYPIRMPVTVTTSLDSFEGQPVDVDYPALPQVVRPDGARMFSTWSSDDFPSFVCKYDASRPLGASYCDAAGANLKDPLTGL
jgi:hypothetical protein